MIGTTRSRVSFFMSRFRKLGYVSYNGRIHVHKSLLSIVLHNQFPKQRVQRPVVIIPRAKRAVKKASKNSLPAIA